ncbi:MFS transporter [Promicromonospora sp. AC04]|uniref:MFS transporter n=1 Tax=Promicromonospora sp. AC04 TaxID=2135723 RepID=UPI001304F4E2|nr:MFS transporter [Promicromonospora sp. AC04]
MTNTQATSAPAAPTRTAPAGPRRHGIGFWVTGLTFLLLMAFSTVPTPLYTLYVARDGYGPFTVTVIFAAYAVGVVASLFFVGHLSDRVGRRPLILLAAALEILAAVGFLVRDDLAGLLVARLVSGVGIGALTATATAYLAELDGARSRPAPGRAAVVATVANLGGLGLGPILSGLLAAQSAHPLVLPYALFAVVMVGLLVATLFVPETVLHRPGLRPYRPQRAAIGSEVRGRFVGGAIGAFTGFAVLGLFSSVAASFVRDELGQPSLIVAGAVAATPFLAGALGQSLLAASTQEVQLRWASVLIVAGPAALFGGVVLASTWLFVAGGLLAGGGAGLLFKAALGRTAALVPPEARAEALALVFLVAYTGLVVPVLAVGVGLVYLPAAAVLGVFVVLVALAGGWAASAMRRGRSGG